MSREAHAGFYERRRVRFPPATLLVICVAGERRHAEALIAETERTIRPLGLALSTEKTRVAHIDEGIDFLGWRIQRHQGSNGRRYVYTYPSKRALASVMAKVKAVTRTDHQQTLDQLIHRLNPVLRGWCAYFRPGVSSRTFNYLRAYVWQRVVRWLRRKHPKTNWRWLRRRYLPGWWPTDGKMVLFNPGGVGTTRYRYRGNRIPTPWESGYLPQTEPGLSLDRLQRRLITPFSMNTTCMPVESRMRGNVHVRFGRRLGETGRLKSQNRAPSRPYSQIQALDRTQASLPMKKGRAGTMTHDYKRNGTTTLFAALDVLTGSVIGECLPRHRHEEFLKFLKTIDRAVPKRLQIHMILDNYATHKQDDVDAWLAKHARFHLHFTPTSSSWLNLVERFFGKLTDKALRRGVFHSVPDLIAAIDAYLQANNANPTPFVWTATADSILEKVSSGRVALEAITT